MAYSLNLSGRVALITGAKVELASSQIDLPVALRGQIGGVPG